MSASHDAQMGAHSPLGFPAFGLTCPTDAPRWIEMVEGSPGQPAWSVWLAHGDVHDGQAQWVLVGTTPKARYARLMTRADGDPEADYVEGLLLQLLERMRPRDGDGPYSRGLVGSLEPWASTRQGWPAVEWRVGGRPVTARVFRFAGAWVAYTGDVDEVWVAALGTTADADGLEFAATDGLPYGVDLTAALDVPAVFDHSRARVLPESTYRPRSRHTDHELLEARGRQSDPGTHGPFRSASG